MALAGLAALGPVLSPASPAGWDSWKPSRVAGATTGNASELRETIPISRRPGAKDRVVMSLGPRALPDLNEGSELRASAEVQISVTCAVIGKRRCVGSPYGYSPRISGWLVLADRRRRSSGPRTLRLPGEDSMRCGQHRPNRNHHCVLVIESSARTIPDLDDLPCEPARCFLNMVVGADHPNAQPGDVMTVGADRANGTVRQDKARLNALVTTGKVDREAVSSHALVHRRIPIALEGDLGRRVVYSVPLPRLEAGSVATAVARQRTGIAGLRYNVFVGSRLVIATDPNDRASHGIARKLPAPGENNGFNCTHGPSAYSDPCVTRKVGFFVVRREVLDAAGKPVHLYLNLVLGALAKLERARSGDRARALPGGGIEARVYSERL